MNFPYYSLFMERYADYIHPRDCNILRLTITLRPDQIVCTGHIDYCSNFPVIEFGGRNLYLLSFTSEGTGTLSYVFEYAN